jgi:formamidopyrimidine-DNA glycosylase
MTNHPDNFGRQFDDIIERNFTPHEMHEVNARVTFGHDTDYKNSLPCQTCGEPVDTDVWHEEMGYCIDCQHNAFDHSDEEK